jgi:hypothetical protein
MKRIILAVVLIATTFGSAFAGSTKAENDAAILAMHQQIATKTAQLETNLKANNMQAAQTTANEVLSLLQRGMRLGDQRTQLEPADKKASAGQKYLQMEAAAHEYAKLSKNVAANGTVLVQKAKAYLNVY